MHLWIYLLIAKHFEFLLQASPRDPRGHTASHWKFSACIVYPESLVHLKEKFLIPREQ